MIEVHGNTNILHQLLKQLGKADSHYDHGHNFIHHPVRTPGQTKLYMKNTDLEIGKRLKMLRQEAGLKQSDIADLVGHSNTAVGRIERGEQTIDLKTILAYKKQFNVSADYIIDGVNDGNEDISDRLKFAEQYIDRLENILKNRT